MTPLLEPLVGNWPAVALSYGTLWLLPDAFGFLFWEMKENWRLYRANRPAALEPEAVGPSRRDRATAAQAGLPLGDAAQAVRPAAQGRARGPRDGGLARRPRRARALQAVERSLCRFVARDVLALLHLSPEWQKKPLSVGEMVLAGNQVRIELRHADYPQTPLRLAVAEQDGLLLRAWRSGAGWAS